MSVEIDNDAKVQGESNSGFGQRHIISITSSVFYAVQINENNDVEVHRTDNGGVSWVLDTSFTGLSGPFSLSMCKSELNDLFVCFVHNTLTVLVKKKDSGTGVWSEVRSTAITASGCNAVIFYNRQVNRLTLLRTHTVVSPAFLTTEYSDDYGGFWNVVNSVVTGSFTSQVKVIHGVDSLVSNGNIHVLWSANQGTSSMCRTTILNSAGTLVSLNDISVAGTAPLLGGAFVTDSSSNRWALLYILASGAYILRVYQNTGISLEVNYSGVDTLLYGMMSIGVDGADNIYVAYVKRADSKAYYRKYTASLTTWGAETDLTVGDGLRPSYEQVSLPATNKLNFIYYTSPVIPG